MQAPLPSLPQRLYLSTPKALQRESGRCAHCLTNHRDAATQRKPYKFSVTQCLCGELKQKSRLSGRDLCCVIEKPYAAVLLRVLMHLAHNTLCTARPFSITSVFCRFGLNVRLVARWENERL